MEEKKAALGLLKQVLHKKKKKKEHIELFQVHLETVGN